MAQFTPLSFQRLSPVEARDRLSQFCARMQQRRTVRDFSAEPIPEGLVDLAIATAGSAPSGANRQPWHFVVVTDPSVKKRIREAAEAEERAFYEQRAPDEWLEALAPLGTDANKPFLETAPALIVVFREDVTVRAEPDGTTEQLKNYYVSESVGIAVGMLLAALHVGGLATLTHTPSPMGFLSEILGRPKHERPYLLIPVGYPAKDAKVPDISRKALDEIRTVV
jgi:iodotyrosine deiodinase